MVISGELKEAKIPKAVTECDPKRKPKKKCTDCVQEDVNKYGLHLDERLK